ncbi:MAG: DUF3307 domain-containing protein [Armatimonadota bacterium]|nr:MAG: DUF3307 domain-containing protein [Armatimonadota bacterium]
MAHALCDFSLQTEIMAKGKSRQYRAEPPTNQRYFPCWPFWLSAHALIWGGGVGLVLGATAGAIGALAHWVTDFAKCESRIGVIADQALHFATLIALALVFGRGD